MNDQACKINALSGRILEFSVSRPDMRETSRTRLVLGTKIGSGSASIVFEGKVLDGGTPGGTQAGWAGSSREPNGDGSCNHSSSHGEATGAADACNRSHEGIDAVGICDKTGTERRRHPSRTVAVKVLKPRFLGTPTHERFLREAELLCRLSHPNLVRGIGLGSSENLGGLLSPCGESSMPGHAHQTGDGSPYRRSPGRDDAYPDDGPRRPACTSRTIGEPTAGTGTGAGTRAAPSSDREAGSPPLPFLVMELVAGPSLAAAMSSESPPDAVESVRIVLGIANVLGYLHLDGRVMAHRDIKPSNIMLASDGTPKLMDLGVAKVQMVAADRLETRLAGTLRYMSPEQVADSSRADTRSDIYSLGMVLFELMGGNLPEDEREMVAQRMSGWVPRISDGLGAAFSDEAGSGYGRRRQTAGHVAHAGAATAGNDRDIPNPQIAEKLDAVLARMCAYEPYERYQMPQDLACDLSELLSEMQAKPCRDKSAAAKRKGRAGRHRARKMTRAAPVRSMATGSAAPRTATTPKSRSTVAPVARRPASSDAPMTAVTPTTPSPQARPTTATDLARLAYSPDDTAPMPALNGKSWKSLASKNMGGSRQGSGVDSASAPRHLQNGEKSVRIPAKTLLVIPIAAALAIAMIAGGSGLSGDDAAHEVPPTGTDIVLQRMDTD